MSLKTLSILGFILSSGIAQAGGSISREDATREVCDESENLCPILKVISLDPVGNAIRMRDGTRIMPYEFTATVNGLGTWVVMRRDEKGHIVLEIR